VKTYTALFLFLLYVSQFITYFAVCLHLLPLFQPLVGVVNDTKKAFIAAESICEFLQRKKRETPPVKPKITGEVEAHIIALACSPVPGCAKWGVRLLADKCVELNYIDSISFKPVQRVLKKHSLSLI